MSDAHAKQIQKLTEAPGAPEIFTDGVCGFFLHNGTLRIAFEASRADHSANPAPITRCVVARVVLPAAGARGLAVGLFDFLKKMGLEPGNVAPSVAVQKTPAAPAAEPPPAGPGAPPKPASGTIEAPDAHEIFADGAAGFFLHNGMLRIAFESSRFDHSSSHAPASRILVARVALPASSASALAVNLFDFLKQMGIDPASVSAVPTVQ